ncbi:MAG TPA: heme-binding beta-barrel domain-containing protein [Acidimicrobiia bacterium]|nr:heme-binding beta-barrel domain-containing protein [Acidimicrobiia bacterium]
MPAPEPTDLGPLAALAGTWEGDEGVDVAFANTTGEVAETRYRERAVFNPFGPVLNGKQSLFGLDYRTAAWRLGEDDPFHTEVGYWLWDGDARQVMRCFMVPRGCTVLAGGPAHVDSTTWTMQAEVGSETYGILSNQYLATAARTTLYQVTIEVRDADTFAYEERTVVEISRLPAPLDHTDRNVMHRVDG